MHVAPREITKHFLRFLVESVTDARIWREYGNGADVPQRWNARDEDLAGMSAGIKEIIFILLSRRDITGQRIGCALGLIGSAFAAATEAGHDDGDRQRDRAFDFHFRSFWLSILFHCHDSLGSLRIVAGEGTDVQIIARNVWRVEGDDLAFPWSEQFGMCEHIFVARRNVVVGRFRGCLVEKRRLNVAGVYCTIEEYKIMTHRKLGRSPDILERDRDFLPG